MSTPAPPAQYQPYITQAASGTGIPQAVVQAQAFAESGYNPGAVSPAGAEGFWQFLPSTYNSVASQAGVQPGTEFNVADETKAYVVYMNQLLSQEGGNVFKALEAYNAGPGNLQAGASYAAGIEKAAGVSQSQQAGQAATLTGIHIPGIGTIPTPGDIGSFLNPANWIKDIGSAILGIFGLGSGKDLFQRLALILLGAALVLVGIRILSSGTGGSKTQINLTEQSSNTSKTSSKTEKSPVSKSRSVESGAAKTDASEAVEAAAIA